MMHLRMAHLFYHYQIKPKKTKKKKLGKVVNAEKIAAFHC